MDPYTITRGRNEDEQEHHDSLIPIETCGFCGHKQQDGTLITYDPTYRICRTCAASDDGHVYSAVINRHIVYHFLTFIEAVDFAVYWLGIVINDEGDVLCDYETLPFEVTPEPVVMFI